MLEMSRVLTQIHLYVSIMYQLKLLQMDLELQ